MAGRVRFPAWVTDDGLEGLCATASVFVLPSFEEGFRLPGPEGDGARGRGRLLEHVVAGRGRRRRRRVFDPRDSGAIVRAMTRILGDDAGRREFVARGHERTRRFTWRRTAQATLDAYRKTLCTSV